MVARIAGLWVPDAEPNPHNTGVIKNCELLPDAPGDIYNSSGWKAWEPWRKAMGLLGHLAGDLNYYPVDAGGRIINPARARVLANAWSDTGGNFLTLDIGVAANVREVLGLYHLQERSPWPEGAIVAEGAVLGRIGTTGSASTGPHLHFTRRSGPPDRFGDLADPMELFDPDPVDGVLDDVLPTLNEMYLWITDAYYGGYNPDFKSLIEVIEHPPEWDRQIILSQRHQ